MKDFVVISLHSKAFRSSAAYKTEKKRRKRFRFLPQMQRLLLYYRVNTYLLAVSAESFETHDPVSRCEQGVISAPAHVETRMDVGSSLAVKDVSCQNELSVGSLGAESFGLAVTAVL